MLCQSILIGQDWELSITGKDVQNIGASHTIRLGTCEDCIDGWSFSEDEYDYPNPFSGEFTNIHFLHLDWYGSIDNAGNTCCEQMEFSSDFRAIHPPGELITWNISGMTGGGLSTNIPIQLSWDKSQLEVIDNDYEIYLFVGNMGYNMRQIESINISQSDLYLDQNYNSNVQILMGGCASTGTTTHYFDLDEDGWGHGIGNEFCLDYAPEGWVPNNDDMNDSIFCTSNDIDECNMCDGNNSAKDCNGDCFGSALVDDCNICSEGNTGHIMNSDKDCYGECFGNAFIDDCNVCSEGNSGHEENSDKDCNGECFGQAIIDNCNDCVEKNFNFNCLDQIFGDGPENVYAQIFDDHVFISWDIPYAQMASYISNYNIYFEESIDNLILLDNTTMTQYHVPVLLDGLFCVSALDEFGNESSLNCIEASEMCSYNLELNLGPNLVSFPCIPDDNSVQNIVDELDVELTGIIGEGEATVYLDGVGWIGALQEILHSSGYWFLREDGNSEENIYQIVGFPPRSDLTYTFPDWGIYLISYQGYDLSNITDAIPDAVEPFVTNIIGEGNAAIQMNGIWLGSLTEWEIGHGYWLSISQGFSFRWNNGSQRTLSIPKNNHQIPLGFEFKQSTSQAFYFIDDVKLTSFDNTDGWIVSYNKDSIVGIRKWEGEIIDIPVMGNDGREYASNFINLGDIPSFKYLDNKTGTLIELTANFIPNFENNGIFYVGALEQSKPIPNQIHLNVFPNPFNPSTNLNFQVPEESSIKLLVYNINGQLITKLTSLEYSSGSYNYIWDAKNLPSGVYFAHLIVNQKTYTQKLILMK